MVRFINSVWMTSDCSSCNKMASLSNRPREVKLGWESSNRQQISPLCAFQLTCDRSFECSASSRCCCQENSARYERWFLQYCDATCAHSLQPASHNQIAQRMQSNRPICTKQADTIASHSLTDLSLITRQPVRELSICSTHSQHSTVDDLRVFNSTTTNRLGCCRLCCVTAALAAAAPLQEPAQAAVHAASRTVSGTQCSASPSAY